MHVHLELIFEDGIVWLARILRERFNSFNDTLSNQILLSECATLRWLECIDIPSPRLYAYGLRGDPKNKVGVAYMLIDKLPGKPYYAHSATREQRTKVIGQWAKILAEFGKQPFDKIGCLEFQTDQVIEVGPIASDRTGTLPPIGPFTTDEELYSSWGNIYSELVEDGQLFSSYTFDAQLMFKYIAQSVSHRGSWLQNWKSMNSGPFYLKHMDDKGDHILIDDDFKITGIIDWTFARVVPAYEAFGPSLFSANLDDMFNGTAGMSEDDLVLKQELQMIGANHCYFESDSIRRLIFSPGIGMGFTLQEAIESFQCIQKSFVNPSWNGKTGSIFVYWTGSRIFEIRKSIKNIPKPRWTLELISWMQHEWDAIIKSLDCCVDKLVESISSFRLINIQNISNHSQPYHIQYQMLMDN